MAFGNNPLLLAFLALVSLVNASRPAHANQQRVPSLPIVEIDASQPVVSRNGTALPPYDTVYYFDQLIDHTDASKGTFQQRYWHTAEYYEAGGCIIIMTPGEGNADGMRGFSKICICLIRFHFRLLWILDKQDYQRPDFATRKLCCCSHRAQVLRRFEPLSRLDGPESQTAHDSAGYRRFGLLRKGPFFFTFRGSSSNLSRFSFRLPCYLWMVEMP